MKPRTWPGADCDACPLRDRPVCPPRPASKQRKLTVVAEAPGMQEEAHGRPLIGASGMLLERVLSRFKVSMSEVHKTNAILCRPSKGFTPGEWKQALKCCNPRLMSEMPRNGETVLVLGAKALAATAGRGVIFPWRGYPLPSTNGEFKVLPALHPAFVLRAPAYEVIFREDVRRGLEGVKEWEWPTMIIHDGPEAEAALKQILAEDKWVGVDVETRTGNPQTAQLRCIGIAGRNVAVSLPFDEFGESRTKHLDLIQEILADPEIGHVYQNRSHDITSLESWGFKLAGPVFDTLDAHAIVAPQVKHDLEFIATTHFPCPHWKTEFRVYDDRKNVYDDADPIELRIYNCKDAWMTLLCMHALNKQLDKTHNGRQLYDETIKLGNLGMRMTRHGVAVNEPAVAKHYEKLHARSIELKKRFLALAGDINMNSSKQLRKLFYDDWGCTVRFYTPKDLPSLKKNALEAIIAEEEGVAAEAALILYEYRTVEKLLSTYIEPLRRPHG